MKRILLLAGLGMWGAIVVAQDRIITISGDTLNGKIVKQEKGWICIRCKDGKKTVRLTPSQLVACDRNYYLGKSVRRSIKSGYTVHCDRKNNLGAELSISTPLCPLYAPSSFYWSINAGWGCRIAPVDPAITGDLYEFLKKMKSGFQISTSFTWFFNEYFGVGAGYTLFTSSHTDRQVYIDTETCVPELSDRLYLHYVGPEIVCRCRHREGKNAFLASWQIGYGAYRENMEMTDAVVWMKSGTFISNISVGYDIGISRHTALGFKMYWAAGAIGHYTVNGRRVDLKAGSKENISTLGLSVGFRFRS